MHRYPARGDFARRRCPARRRRRCSRSPSSNFTFAPQVLTVPAGTRVVWTNRDDTAHLVAGTPSATLRSPPLDTGDRYGFLFYDAGHLPLFLGALHPMMTGTIVVK